MILFYFGQYAWFYVQGWILKLWLHRSTRHEDVHLVIAGIGMGYYASYLICVSVHLQLSAHHSRADEKCDGPTSTSSYTLTCKDPKIQELIDDCPSFDLGFWAEGIAFFPLIYVVLDVWMVIETEGGWEMAPHSTKHSVYRIHTTRDIWTIRAVCVYTVNSGISYIAWLGVFAMHAVVTVVSLYQEESYGLGHLIFLQFEIWVCLIGFLTTW
jgi:hypothetical protein